MKCNVIWCMYARMYVRMYIYIYIYICMYVCMYVFCLSVCLYVCMYAPPHLQKLLFYGYVKLCIAMCKNGKASRNARFVAVHADLCAKMLISPKDKQRF